MNREAPNMSSTDLMCILNLDGDIHAVIVSPFLPSAKSGSDVHDKKCKKDYPPTL